MKKPPWAASNLISREGEQTGDGALSTPQYAKDHAALRLPPSGSSEHKARAL